MDTLLSCCLHDPAKETLIYIPRFTHRLSLIQAWDIPPGQRLLDIGCGQGESVLALALAVTPSGHVTGIDDAPPDYGSPFALAESQTHIQQSALGPRTAFHRTDTISFLQSLRPAGPSYDAAVLCHSLWYFPSGESILSLFHTLATAARMPRLYLAEYSLQPSLASQGPHILSTRASALLSAHGKARDPDFDNSLCNARAPLERSAILDAATDAGYRVRRHGLITPEPDMLEGHFDATHVAGPAFRKRIADANLTERQGMEIMGLAEQVGGRLKELADQGIKTVRAMDSWWAVLELDTGD